MVLNSTTGGALQRGGWGESDPFRGLKFLDSIQT